MAAVAPTIGWVTVQSPGYISWHSETGGPSNFGSPLINLPIDTPVAFSVGTLGNVSFTVTGDVQSSGPSITNLSSTALLAAGQLIQNAAIPYVEGSGQGGQWPCTITAVYTGSDSLDYANGIFNEDLGGWTRNQPPSATVTGATLTVTDYAPAGELAAIVSPNTGVTITDQNADGTGNVSNIGNGLAIMNLVGDAEGGFHVSFGNVGTYTVTASFTTSDPNYSTITLAPAVAFQVT